MLPAGTLGVDMGEGSELPSVPGGVALGLTAVRPGLGPRELWPDCLENTDGSAAQRAFWGCFDKIKVKTLAGGEMCDLITKANGL